MTIKNPQKGQSLAIAAVALAAIIAFVIVAVRLAMLFAADAFLQQRVDFAAAAAARADGDALVAGDIKINQERAVSSIRAELTASFTQMEFVGVTAAQMIESATIEFLDPPDGSCQAFPGDPTCYTVPAVRVTSEVPFNLFGIIIPLTRQGIATVSAIPGAGGSPPMIASPTPIVLPTEVIYPTPGG